MYPFINCAKGQSRSIPPCQWYLLPVVPGPGSRMNPHCIRQYQLPPSLSLQQAHRNAQCPDKLQEEKGKIQTEIAHGITRANRAFLIHALNYGVEKQVNNLNIVELFLTCLFRKQISISYYITLLNYLFTAQNTCVICASCYYKCQINVHLFLHLCCGDCIMTLSIGSSFFQRNLFQSNFLCHVTNKWKQRPPILYVKSVIPWLWSNALNNQAKYVKGLFNTLCWWSKSIKFIQPWRRLWLSYTSAVLVCVDHKKKK